MISGNKNKNNSSGENISKNENKNLSENSENISEKKNENTASGDTWPGKGQNHKKQ